MNPLYSQFQVVQTNSEKSEKMFRLRKNGIAVCCYPTPYGKYEYWTVTWIEAGKRKRKKAKSKSAAIIEGKRILKWLTEIKGSVVDEAIVSEVSRVKALIPDITIDQLCNFWIQNHTNIKSATTNQIATEFITAKTNAGFSKVHIIDLKWRLESFVKLYPDNITSVTASSIQKWIDASTSPASARNNFRVLKAFIGYAKAMRYLPDAFNEHARVMLPKIIAKPIGIFYPDNIREILKRTRGALQLYVAMGAFSGLRQSELLRIEWEDVKEKFITMGGHKTKTSMRRLVPISNNLAQWIAPFRKPKGKIFNFSPMSLFLALRSALKGTKIKWIHNGLRHSYCSYRVAQIQDANKVALEAGNSPTMIFRHYRELVTPEQAKEWFEIRPQSVTTTRDKNKKTVNTQ